MRLARATEDDLNRAYTVVGRRQADELDIERFVASYPASSSGEPERLHHDLFDRPPHDRLALSRDLHHLWLMAQEAHIS